MKKAVRQAYVLDIGSASVRFLIGRIGGNGTLEILYNSGRVTNLRQALDDDGNLDLAAAGKTISAVREMMHLAGPLVIGDGAVLCTQTLRQARNSGWFLDRIREVTGMFPEILSGHREGELALKGSEDLMRDGDLLIDMGGGSTEILHRPSGIPLVITSIPLGAGVPLKPENGSGSGDVSGCDAEMSAADAAWNTLLAERRFPHAERAIVLGGTVTNLASVYLGHHPFMPGHLHGKILSVGELYIVTKALSMMTPNERAGVRGLEKGREPIIVNGGCLLVSLCQMLEIDQVIVSEKGIRFGRLYELLPSDF